MFASNLLNVETGLIENITNKNNEILLIYIIDEDIDQIIIEKFYLNQKENKNNIQTIFMFTEEPNNIMIKLKLINYNIFEQIKVYTINSNQENFIVNKFILNYYYRFDTLLCILIQNDKIINEFKFYTFSHYSRMFQKIQLMNFSKEVDKRSNLNSFEIKDDNQITNLNKAYKLLLDFEKSVYRNKLKESFYWFILNLVIIYID